MNKIKRLNLFFIFLMIGLLLYFWPANFICAQDVSKDNLQFSVEGGKLYFFQPQTGRIFVYQTTTNRFSHLITLEELGKDLKQSRSLSVLEEKENK